MIAAAPRAGGLATHGTSAKIMESRRIAGGRFLLVIQGQRRFRVLQTSEIDGYKNASISWAADEPPPMLASEAGLRPDDVEAGAAARGEALAADIRSALALWLGMVRSYEQRPGQIDGILRDIGPLPPSGRRDGSGPRPEELEALGLWAAACLNPLPPLGVAPEIRLRAIEETDTLARLRLVLSAAEDSLAAMGASRRTPILRRIVGAALSGALTLSALLIMAIGTAYLLGTASNAALLPSWMDVQWMSDPLHAMSQRLRSLTVHFTAYRKAVAGSLDALVKAWEVKNDGHTVSAAQASTAMDGGDGMLAGLEGLATLMTPGWLWLIFEWFI